MQNKNPREDLSRYKAKDKVEVRYTGQDSQWHTGVVEEVCVCDYGVAKKHTIKVRLDRVGIVATYQERDWDLLRKPGEWAHGEAVEFKTFPGGPQSLSEGVWHRGTIVDKAQEYYPWRTVRRDGPYTEINVEVENIRYPQAKTEPKWQPGDIVEFMMNGAWVTGAIVKSASFASWEVRRDGTNYIVYETYVRKPTPGPTALDVAELKQKLAAVELDRDDAKRWLDRERLRAEKAEHQVKQLEARLDGIKRYL